MRVLRERKSNMMLYVILGGLFILLLVMAFNVKAEIIPVAHSNCYLKGEVLVKAKDITPETPMGYCVFAVKKGDPDGEFYAFVSEEEGEAPVLIIKIDEKGQKVVWRSQ